MQKRQVFVLSLWSMIFHANFCIALEKIFQQSSSGLSNFYAYNDISIIHFNVPENSVSAVFKFTAKEEKTGGIGKCEEQKVLIYLKSGSIAFVNADQSKISAHLLKGRRDYYSYEILSNGQEHEFEIKAPLPGDWFAIAFRPWENPESGRITQQGLKPSCGTNLDSYLLVEPTKILSTPMNLENHKILLNSVNNSAVIRFFVPPNIDKCKINLSLSCKKCEILAFVTSKESLIQTVVNSTEANIFFVPYENAMHYLTLRLQNIEESLVTLNMINEGMYQNTNNVKLFRKSSPEFLIFDYKRILEKDNKSLPLNLTADTLSVMKFEIGAMYDVGGMLTIGLNFSKEGNNNEKNRVLVACVSLGYISVITETGNCVRRNSSRTLPDVYTTNEKNSTNVPYPEPGTWFVTARSFSLSDAKCECAKKCIQEKPCDACSCMKPSFSRVEVSISSKPCGEEACGDWGMCRQHLNSGFVFSACRCFAGFRGFDCSDGTYVLSKTMIIVRLLFLTVSNVAFIGSIFLAIRRQYYAESAVYAAVLFSSIFYHACDEGEGKYSFCISKLGVLQFCDFYYAILSIWVTLVAMMALSTKLTGFCQLVGALVLAYAVEYDKTALWVFLMPAVTGSFFIAVSWAKKCRARGTYMYPARRYQRFYLPVGLLVVATGLICYAFFETQSNYYLIHSFWHVCTAVGVMLLLPKKKYME